jgi:hypothetical protein
MDQREAGVIELEHRVDVIRHDLGDLVSELGLRRHRAGKPLLAAAVVLVGLAVGALLLWRHRRRIF